MITDNAVPASRRVSGTLEILEIHNRTFLRLSDVPSGLFPKFSIIGVEMGLCYQEPQRHWPQRKREAVQPHILPDTPRGIVANPTFSVQQPSSLRTQGKELLCRMSVFP